MPLKESIMTGKVLLYIRNPKNTIVNFVCEFTRIPAVGEYIWLDPDEANFIKNNDCFKVVCVQHTAFVDCSKNSSPYNAFIYAVKEHYEEVLKASGF